MRLCFKLNCCRTLCFYDSWCSSSQCKLSHQAGITSIQVMCFEIMLKLYVKIHIRNFEEKLDELLDFGYKQYIELVWVPRIKRASWFPYIRDWIWGSTPKKKEKMKLKKFLLENNKWICSSNIEVYSNIKTWVWKKYWVESPHVILEKQTILCYLRNLKWDIKDIDSPLATVLQ